MSWSAGCMYATLFAADLEAFFRGLGSEFSGKRAKLGWGDAGIMLSVVTVIVGLVFLLSRYFGKGDHETLNSPQSLFAELCKLHGLGFGERRTLTKLAKVHKLEHPARLFLEPERFDNVSDHPHLAPQAGMIRELRQRLFVGMTSNVE